MALLLSDTSYLDHAGDRLRQHGGGHPDDRRQGHRDDRPRQAAADHAVFYPLPRASASADRRDDASGTVRDRRLTP